MFNKPKVIEYLLACVFAVEMLFYNLNQEFIIPLFLLSIILLIFLYTSNRPLYIPWTFSRILILYFFSVIMSAVFTGFTYQTTIECIKILSYLSIVVLGSNIFRRNETSFQNLTFIFCFPAGFLALIGLLEYTSRFPSQKTIALLEPFHWPSLAAGFFMLITPNILTLYLDSKKNLPKIIIFMCLSLLLLAWFLTTENILYILLILGLIIFNYFFNSKKPDLGTNNISKNNWKLTRILIMRDLLLVLLVLSVILPNIMLSFGSNKLPKEITLYLNQYLFFDKEDVGRFSFESIKSHFFTGIGAGNFGMNYRSNLIKPWTWSDFASNELIQTFVEVGITGFIAQLILFGYLIFLSIKRSLISYRNRNFFSFGIAITCTFFIVRNLTTFSLRVFPLTILFFLFLGYILKEETVRILKPKSSYFLAVPLVLILFIVIMDGILFKYSQKMIFYKNISSGTKILSWLSQRPTFLLNPKLYLWLSAINIEKKERDQAISNLKNIYMQEPLNQEIDYQIAKLLYSDQKLNEAQTILENYIYKNMFASPKYYLALSKINSEKNNIALSQYWLKRASLVYPMNLNIRLSSVGLAVLDTTDYLPSIQNIYYSLFEFSKNNYYSSILQTLLY